MFDPTKPPLEKAVVTALIQKIQAGIADLNTMLAADPDTVALLDTTRYGFSAVQSGHVQRGHLLNNWQPKVVTTDPHSGGSIRISVAAGDYPQGSHQTTQNVYIPDSTNRGTAVTLVTTVMVFVHAYWRRFEDPVEQQRVEEITLEVLSCWIRAGCLNRYSYGYSSDVPLISSEYNTTQLITPETGVPVVDADGLPCYDLLAKAMSQRGSLGVFRRGLGQNEELLGLHYTHQGTVGR